MFVSPLPTGCSYTTPFAIWTLFSFLSILRPTVVRCVFLVILVFFSGRSFASAIFLLNTFWISRTFLMSHFSRFWWTSVTHDTRVFLFCWKVKILFATLSGFILLRCSQKPYLFDVYYYLLIKQKNLLMKI